MLAVKYISLSADLIYSVCSLLKPNTTSDCLDIIIFIWPVEAFELLIFTEIVPVNMRDAKTWPLLLWHTNAWKWHTCE